MPAPPARTSRSARCTVPRLLGGGAIGSPDAAAAARRSATGASGAAAAAIFQPVVAREPMVSSQSRGVARASASVDSSRLTAGSVRCQAAVRLASPGIPVTHGESATRRRRSGNAGAVVSVIAAEVPAAACRHNVPQMM
jgi:hypothetical protein